MEPKLTEIEKAVLRCKYEGMHFPMTDGFRHPISGSMTRMASVDATTALAIPYYMVYRCRSCGVEERVKYNC